MRVFTKDGYEGATTANLAKAAGISEPILYRHFHGKESLFNAVLARAAALILGDWRHTIQGIDNVRDRIMAIVTVHPHLMAEGRPAYGVLQVAQASTSHPAVRKALADAYSKFEEYLVYLIQAGQDKGELRLDMNAQSAAWTLLSLGLALRLTHELELPIAGDKSWTFGAGSRYLDTMKVVSND